jgi:hypothetical protein
MTKRILLHILCMLLDHEWRWHWAGIRRELRHKGWREFQKATLLDGEKSKSERPLTLVSPSPPLTATRKSLFCRRQKLRSATPGRSANHLDARTRAGQAIHSRGPTVASKSSLESA